MSSVNKVFLLGHVGQDPVVKYTQTGLAVASLSIATSKKWKDKDGEKQEKTEWHKVVFWRKLAEIVGQYVRKGSQIHIEGSLQTRKWQDSEGVDRYSTEVVADGMLMLGGSSKTSKVEKEDPEEKAQEQLDIDDDIPF